MEDSIEMILQDYGRVLPSSRPHPVLSACTGALLTGFYGLWSLFVMPGFRKIPWNLKIHYGNIMDRALFLSSLSVEDEQENIMIRSGLSEDSWNPDSPAEFVIHTDILPSSFTGSEWEIRFKVPYLPSSKVQTLNTMKLLEGRTGHLVDLGSGDGRLVFAASSAGFRCTGFEINSILVAYARSKALWAGVPSSQATFVKKDFWKMDLSTYNNVTAFLAPGVMGVLGEKLLRELPDDALVIACRFPFPNWPHQSSVGSGLDQTFAYDIGSVRSHLRNVVNPVV